MERGEYLGLYAEGWTQGNWEKIQEAISEDFTLDDPNGGPMDVDEFKTYFKGLVTTLSPKYGGNFMNLTEIQTQDEDDVLSVWCWWSIPGGPQGSGLIKVSDNGVVSERLCHYAPPI